MYKRLLLDGTLVTGIDMPLWRRGKPSTGGQLPGGQNVRGTIYQGTIYRGTNYQGTNYRGTTIRPQLGMRYWQF